MIDHHVLEKTLKAQEVYLRPGSLTWEKRRASLLLTRSLQAANPELARTLSSLNVVSADQVAAGSKLNLIWSCKDCDSIFVASADNRSKGRGCPLCAQSQRVTSFKKTKSSDGRSFADRAPQWLLDQWHPDNTVLPNEISYGASLNVRWLCDECGHEWTASLKNRLMLSTPCSRCRPKSRIEAEFITALRHVYKGEIVQNSKPLRFEGKRFEIDVLIPELHIAFEIQDLATHSRNSDTEISKLAYLGDRFKKGPTYHELKRKLAKEQLNVQLIDVWEDEIRSADPVQLIANYLK